MFMTESTLGISACSTLASLNMASDGQDGRVSQRAASEGVHYGQVSDVLQLAVAVNNAAQGGSAFQSFASPMPSTSSGSSAPASNGEELSFDSDARGWKIIHVPITKRHYRIRISDKLVDVRPQGQLLTISVNPARAMPDEWTVGGLTFFFISPGNTDEASGDLGTYACETPMR